jgi:hypothetical protein
LILVSFVLLVGSAAAQATTIPPPQVIKFQSGGKTLHGLLYKPGGAGPFPAIVFNHGSAPGMASKDAFDALGPQFQAAATMVRQFTRRRSHARLLWRGDLDAGCHAIPRAALHRSEIIGGEASQALLAQIL